MSLDALQKKYKKKDDSVFIDSDDDEVIEVYTTGKRKKTKRVKEYSKPKSTQEGFNYTGIGLLLLFIIPAMLTMTGAIMDYYYPEAAAERMVRNRVVNCYTAAAPDKLDSIDSFMKKYKGRESKLLQNLELKYPKISECAFRR